MLSRNTLDLASTILAKIRKSFAEYDEECEQAAKEGFRPHYCIHGADLWVDWDCVCQYCEDGLGYWNYGRCAREALDRSKAAWEEVQSRIDAVVQLSVKGAPIQVADFGEWVMEPVTVLGWIPVYAR